MTKKKVKYWGLACSFQCGYYESKQRDYTGKTIFGYCEKYKKNIRYMGRTNKCLIKTGWKKMNEWRLEQ